MEEKILDLLAELCEDEIVKSNKDIELFETGLLDSLAFAELLFGIEDNWGLIIAPSEIEREEINTPQKIISLIKERLEKMKRLVAFAVALVLFALTCIGVWQWEKTSLFEKKTVLAYHNSDTRNSSKTVLEELFKGNAIPVLGSSELSASDDVAYPPALFHNGNSDFNMILIGRGSMQSLHHAINLGAMADILPDKKVVLILSPQWFTDLEIAC